MTTNPTQEQIELLTCIRVFEETLISAFHHGELRGTTHTSLGQEAIAVAAMSFVKAEDVVFSNHRCHGHFLAYGGSIESLLAEIMGTPGGVCAGIGGSQHLHFKNFYSNGVQGGIVPVACGMAMAVKVKGLKGLVVCFLGDGTLGEGAVYESFNLASLWSLPVLFVIENNRFAQSTPVRCALAGNIASRSSAFDIETQEIESNDLAELLPTFRRAFDHVRMKNRPFCQIIHTYRLGPHSKGDDTRTEAEISPWRRHDPIMLAEHHVGAGVVMSMRLHYEARMADAIQRLKMMAPMSAPSFREDDNLIPQDGFDDRPGWAMAINTTMLMVEILRNTFVQLMTDYPRIHLLGEDLVDPYGGAFKATKGLSTRFPDRIHSTPISEGAIVGLANGMALRGLRPIVEIMFGDFMTLTFDQILNHMTKFEHMYAGQVRCPVIVRTPMGGYRGYGPTHSQSLEKFFTGIPGLVVTAISQIHDTELIWKRMIALDVPILHIENKGLYGLRPLVCREGRMGDFFVRSTRTYFPSIELCLTDFDVTADVLLICYGGMLGLCMEAARQIFLEEERIVRVIILSQLSPLPTATLIAAIDGIGCVVVVEEGTRRCGWGAEVVATLAEQCWQKSIQITRYTAADSVIPASQTGETTVLPSVVGLCNSIRKLVFHG